MDPFTQRLRSRNFRRRFQRFYLKKKTTIFSNSTALVESEITLQCEIKKEDIDPILVIEASRIMDSFLNKALGNTVLHRQNDGNETISKSGNDKYCDTPSSSESHSEKIVEYPLCTLNDYRAMTRPRRKTRPAIPSVVFYVHELKHFETERTLGKVETLQKEVDHQKNILQQVSKALTYCCSLENIKTSSERVECERHLLLASHKYTGMAKKIDMLKKEIRNGCPLKAEKGTVNISNLSLTFTEPLYAQTHNEESWIWIVCLLSHEDTVMATEAKLLKKDLTVKFQELFTFNDLLNDFSINVQLFTLLLKKESCMTKHYFKKLLPGASANILRIRQNHEVINSSVIERQAIFKTTDFQLRGSFSIELGDLEHYLTCKKLPPGQIQMFLNWDVESKVEISGFLTIGESVGEYFVWERRWCFLEECKLKYWNYPSDRENNMTPLGTLDLRQCTCISVEPLDQTVCSKPRTFELELTQKQNEDTQISDPIKTEKTVKYLFSTDTSKDLSQWCMVLTKNLDLLKKWKKINFNC